MPLARTPHQPESGLGISSAGAQQPIHGCGAGGFTLIELIIVIMIFGIIATLVGTRLGTFTFWREEAFIRRLAETIDFLHHQAVVDQAFYRLEFNFDESTPRYSIGILKADTEVETGSLAEIASDAGNLSLELASFLSPSLGKTQTVIPPPAFPSLADPVDLPSGVTFRDIRTARGLYEPKQGETAYILFSPRGFSEFAVIHLKMSQGNEVTLLINSFTGIAEIYRSYQDFEWGYHAATHEAT